MFTQQNEWLSSSLKNIAITLMISLCIVFLGQYLWNYVLDTFSTKKTKDLVNGQIEKYKKVMGLVNNPNPNPSIIEGEYIDKIDKKDMNDELEQFMNQELLKIDNL